MSADRRTRCGRGPGRTCAGTPSPTQNRRSASASGAPGHHPHHAQAGLYQGRAQGGRRRLRRGLPTGRHGRPARRLVAVLVAVVRVYRRPPRYRPRADRASEGGRHRVNNDRQTWKACRVRSKHAGPVGRSKPGANGTRASGPQRDITNEQLRSTRRRQTSWAGRQLPRSGRSARPRRALSQVDGTALRRQGRGARRAA